MRQRRHGRRTEKDITVRCRKRLEDLLHGARGTRAEFQRKPRVRADWVLGASWSADEVCRRGDAGGCACRGAAECRHCLGKAGEAGGRRAVHDAQVRTDERGTAQPASVPCVHSMQPAPLTRAV